MPLTQREYSITGTVFCPGSGMLLQRLSPAVPLELRREPANEHYPNGEAVAIFWGTRKLGYVPRGFAAEIAPHIDAGVRYVTRKAGASKHRMPPTGVFIMQWNTDDLAKEPHIQTLENEGGPARE